MGQTQTTGRDIQSFLKEYEEVRTEFDERMGEIKIYRKISNPEIQVLSKELWFEQESTYLEFNRKMQKRKSIFSENVAPLLLIISKL